MPANTKAPANAANAPKKGAKRPRHSDAAPEGAAKKNRANDGMDEGEDEVVFADKLDWAATYSAYHPATEHDVFI